MEYWRGAMNWPIPPDWKCPICDQRYGLTWGLVHGECRCNLCHAIFSMGASNAMLPAPKLRIRTEYLGAAKSLWAIKRLPLDEFTQEEWDDAKNGNP